MIKVIKITLSLISLAISIAALIKANRVNKRLTEIISDTEKLIENAKILDKYHEM